MKTALDTAGLDKNFQFLVLEVRKQVQSTRRMLASTDLQTGAHIRARDDYVDHLKSIIENKCFSVLRRHADMDKELVDSLRSLNVIAANLEHIADYATSIARQAMYFSDVAFFHRYEFDPFFDKITEALQLVVDAYEQRDLSKALEICRSEAELDRLYKAKFERILTEMQSGRDVPNLVTSLFIFHYLERIGDSLLNIGEAILFFKLGEKLKLDQYRSLRETLAAVRHNGEAEQDIDFEGIWETRSGCRIGKVSPASEEFRDDQEVIYKEGAAEKIRLEKEGIERWNALVPGLPPRILDYREGPEDAAILLEYLEGRNVQQLTLDPEVDFLDEALRRVQEVVLQTWRKTKQDRPVKSGFLAQLIDRLGDVYVVHPGFADARQQIGNLVIPSLDELLRRTLRLDDALLAPFAVFGHGDFNLDNIIVDPVRGTVHFVDLHRSADMDYVQDVSVFLVSAFRVPVKDRVRRKRLNQVAGSFYRFALDFAAEENDRTFQARLALGLVRSFITSTRFEFNREFSRQMLARATFLLSQIDDHQNDWESYALPVDVIVY